MFEVVLNADKSRGAAAFINVISAKNKYGFGLNDNAAIIPLNKGAEYSCRLGIDDHLKFQINQRTGNDILAEAWELDYQRDEYVLTLSDKELKSCEHWKQELGLEDRELVIGFNTGCSNLFSLKKLEVETQAAAIKRIVMELPHVKIILLGGREDTERNQQIIELVGHHAISTPTTLGLRQGIILENLANVVISGDSLGMHIAIALKKYTIAWFGLSCPSEIDLYNRGVKIVRDIPCAPCWKKQCDMEHGPICVTEFDPESLVEAVLNYAKIQDAKV